MHFFEKQVFDIDSLAKETLLGLNDGYQRYIIYILLHEYREITQVSYNVLARVPHAQAQYRVTEGDISPQRCNQRASIASEILSGVYKFELVQYLFIYV